MKLRLTLIQCPPAQGGDISRDLGTGRLVIGRGPDCDWVLNDPERLLSKAHCLVEFKGGVYVVIDSSTNGVFLNDNQAPIGRGNSAVIGDGDRLRLGGFVMRAGFAAEDAPPANDPFLAVLRGSGPPAADPGFGGPAGDDPFALPAFQRGSMPVMPIPDDDDLFGEPAAGGSRGFAGWERTAAGGSDTGGGGADWPDSTQTDFVPSGLGTMRVGLDGAGGGIPDDWLDEPVAAAPPADAPPLAAAPPAPPALAPDWDDEPLVPPAFAARAAPPSAAPLAPSGDPGGDPALTRALVDVVLTMVRRQAALEALLGLDPDDTLAQGDSLLRRATDPDDALARLRALPPAEAEELLRAVIADGAAHQSALLAAVRELTGETADGGTRLAALYRRLLPIHRHALGG
ncbi:FHA domain-containing protein [Azospirillum sp. TSO35-2]|uniref:type VI secretion system-associated FHA domain protein n=1 Tax=Azospirillum sp. TSO35-2 TaxID=716796 RepID=UPI000D61B8D0|nr:FHA domain-containing protein [Azospirillum sp. TSO35-2]PWC37543.1 hypothetical protein TSO352_08345 [Azospirillum sp. TSO35-2]